MSVSQECFLPVLLFEYILSFCNCCWVKSEVQACKGQVMCTSINFIFVKLINKFFLKKRSFSLEMNIFQFYFFKKKGFSLEINLFHFISIMGMFKLKFKWFNCFYVFLYTNGFQKKKEKKKIECL